MSPYSLSGPAALQEAISGGRLPRGAGLDQITKSPNSPGGWKPNPQQAPSSAVSTPKPSFVDGSSGVAKPQPLNFKIPKTAPTPPGLKTSPVRSAAPLAGVGSASGATATAGTGAAATAGVVVGGGVVGVAAGEGIRRKLVEGGNEGLAYPKNTSQLLSQPGQTLRDGIKGTAEAYGFPPEWWPQTQPNETPSPVPVTTNGDAPFSGGQSPGVLYDVRYVTEYTQGPVGNSRQVTNSGWNRFYGPISPFRGRDQFNRITLGFSHQGGDFTALAAAEHTNPFVRDIDVSRVDGQPDTGGDPQGEPEVKTGAAPGSIPAHSPSTSTLPGGSPIITPGAAPAPSGLPGLNPAPQPQLNPRSVSSPESPPFAEPSGLPSLLPPVLPGLAGSPSGRISRNNKVQPAPANLNQPQPTRKPAPAQPSPCNSGCSVSLEVKLDSLKDDKNKEQGSCTLDEICQKIDQYFEPSTSVSVPFVDCPTGEVDPETGEPVPPEVTPLSADGAGFVGVFQLLESILEGVRLTFDKVPCPEEEAAEDDFPVIIYPSDIYTEFNLESRLLLELTPVDDFPKRTNTSSKWSIEIPNPRADLNWCDDFEDFRFFKGPWYGRAIWSSSGIRSGTYCKDEDEARRVVGLLMGLTQASPKRIRVTDSGREGMYSEEVRVIRAVRSTIENGVVTSCVQYVPTSC